MPLFNKITNLVHDQVKKVKQLHGKDVKVLTISCMQPYVQDYLPRWRLRIQYAASKPIEKSAQGRPNADAAFRRVAFPAVQVLIL